MRILLKAGRQVWLIVIEVGKAARIARRLFRGDLIGAHRTLQFYWPALPSTIRRRVIPHCRARTHGLRRFRDAAAAAVLEVSHMSENSFRIGQRVALSYNYVYPNRHLGQVVVVSPKSVHVHFDGECRAERFFLARNGNWRSEFGRSVSIQAL
jgi:hypothetical protein